MYSKLGYIGKGVYIWRPRNICGGDVQATINRFISAGVKTVCIKLVDGSYIYPYLEPLINACRAAGIRVGGWGYVYLKFDALAEAKATIKACQMYQPEFYLVDAEGHAAWQTAAAWVYSHAVYPALKKMGVLVGLNSYWYPKLHPELPWQALRTGAQFDAPQIYWRGARPVEKYRESKENYAKMTPALPFALPAGDMYYEHGIQPAPGQITAFLTEAKRDGANGVIMWSADQGETTPELWAEFAAFDWDSGTTEPAVLAAQPVITPLYAGVVTARSLYVRKGPDIGYYPVGGLMRGDRVEVYGESGGWLRVKTGKIDGWSSGQYIKKL
jgi:hypothetical protein